MEMGSSSCIENSGFLEYKPGNGHDGWYIVSISLRDGKLMIHYQKPTEKRDEELDLAELKTAEDLYAKFRRLSTQLKDKECEKVMPMWPVLVAYSAPADHGDPLKEATSIPNSSGYRYFDARLDEVSLPFLFLNKYYYIDKSTLYIFLVTCRNLTQQ